MSQAQPPMLAEPSVPPQHAHKRPSSGAANPPQHQRHHFGPPPPLGMAHPPPHMMAWTPPTTPSPTFIHSFAMPPQSAPQQHTMQIPLRATSGMSGRLSAQGSHPQGGHAHGGHAHGGHQPGGHQPGGHQHGGHQHGHQPYGGQPPPVYAKTLNNDRLMERYRGYLERSGVAQAITHALIALFESSDKEAGNAVSAGMDTVDWPADPIHFIASSLGAATVTSVSAHEHEREMQAVYAQMDRVLVENGKLRTQLNVLSVDKAQAQLAHIQQMSISECSAMSEERMSLPDSDEGKENMTPVQHKKLKKSPMPPPRSANKHRNSHASKWNGPRK